MYLTNAVYVLCIALMIWGGKFAGFKKHSSTKILRLWM